MAQVLGIVSSRSTSRRCEKKKERKLGCKIPWLRVHVEQPSRQTPMPARLPCLQQQPKNHEPSEAKRAEMAGRSSVDMCQGSISNAHPQHARGVPHGRFHPKGQPEACEHAMEGSATTRAHRFWKSIAHRTQDRPASGQNLQAQAAAQKAGRSNIQQYSSL
jgi:hypothetical protein